jgi:hypothetical protein
MTAVIGKIRKAVIHDGHQGPKEIGKEEFDSDWIQFRMVAGFSGFRPLRC